MILFWKRKGAKHNSGDSNRFCQLVNSYYVSWNNIFFAYNILIGFVFLQKST